MAFDAPAPLPLRRRIAEHGEVVELGVANDWRATTATTATTAAATTAAAVPARRRRHRRGAPAPDRRGRSRWRRPVRPEPARAGAAPRRGRCCRRSAGQSSRPFHLTQDVLELHDVRGRHVPALAQARLHQIVRGRALRLIHFLPRQSVAREHARRNEVPARPLFAGHGIARLLTLLGRQARQKLARGRGHAGGRALPRDARRDGEKSDHDETDEQADHNTAGQHAHKGLDS